MSQSQTYYDRMVSLISEVFSHRDFVDHLEITNPVLKKLKEIHTCTLSEVRTDKGPTVWILLIPCKKEVMDDFVAKKINEMDVLNRTDANDSYDSVYLCSACTLPEFRRKGLATQLCVKAIETIKQSHDIKYLCAWPYSDKSESFVEMVALLSELPLYKRPRDYNAFLKR